MREFDVTARQHRRTLRSKVSSKVKGSLSSKRLAATYKRVSERHDPDKLAARIAKFISVPETARNDITKIPLPKGAGGRPRYVLIKYVTEPTIEEPVKSDAFAAGARARAILRGREIAAKDLKDSGGAFELSEVRALLHGISRQRVDQLVKSGQLLAVPGPSNSRRYPAVQFDFDGAVVSGLKEVRAALPTKSPWTVLNFLIHPDDRLQGKRPIELLRKGQVAAVVKAAARMAHSGA